MAIENWKNKIFKGNQFDSGVYDDSFDIFTLQKMGLPYAMACFEIGSNQLIVIGMERDNQSPRDFINENQKGTFTLDDSKLSRKIMTMYGEKIVHYAKRVNSTEIEDKTLELDFVFNSSDHLRYENGKHVSGPHGGASRALKVEANITGNEGYTVTMFNTDGGKKVVQMAPKQMKLIGADSEKIQLKGYGQDQMGESFADYGFTIFHNEGKIVKCILHMYDRNVDIEYLKSDDQIPKPKEENLTDYFIRFKAMPMHIKMNLAQQTDELVYNGYEFYQKGDLLNAVIYFKKALEIFPLNDDALNNLAVCYNELSDYENFHDTQVKLAQLRELGL